MEAEHRPALLLELTDLTRPSAPDRFRGGGDTTHQQPRKEAMPTMPKPTLSPEADARLVMPRAFLAQARSYHAEVYASEDSTLTEKWEASALLAKAETDFRTALTRELVGR